MANLTQTGGVSIKQAKEVIAKGHPPMAEGVVLIDFDGTIVPFGYLFDYATPFEGVADFTKVLKDNGYKIGIFTSRLSPKWLKDIGHTEAQHIFFITSYCEKYNIKFDFITAEKQPSVAYIDDKGISFNGSWSDVGKEFVTRGLLSAE